MFNLVPLPEEPRIGKMGRLVTTLLVLAIGCSGELVGSPSSPLTASGVIEARDGLEALELAKQERFDAVSTDVIMPRMDGFTLTRKLREMHEYRRVPIVMVTSKDEKIDKIRGFDAGVDDYLVKPFGKAELLRVLARVVPPAGRS